MPLIFQWLNLAGGVALILFGVGYLRKALDRLFGARLEAWISAACQSRVRALLSGLGISLLAPSSTTMALLSVHALQARQATARQALALLFGASIGLTATIQLVAFRLTPYAPVIILVGFIIAQFGGNPRLRYVGRLILGIGFIFLGILTIQNALAPNSTTRQLLLAGLTAAQKHAWSLLVVAGLLAVLTQSTTAIIALMIAFSTANPVASEHIVAWVIGANLGIGLTVLLTGWRNANSRQLGLEFLLAQLMAAFAALLATDWLVQILQYMPGGPGHLVANIHTGFNVLLAILGSIFLTPLSWLVESLSPQPSAREISRYMPRIISQRPPESLALALVQARQEIFHYGQLVRENFSAAWRGILQRDDVATDTLRDEQPQIEHLATEIQTFLAGLSAAEANRFRESSEPMVLSRMLAELEIIQGLIANNLARLAHRMQIAQLSFSEEGQQELDRYYQKIATAFDLVLSAIEAGNPTLAHAVYAQNKGLGWEADEMRDHHLARISRKVPGSFEISGIHLELITALRTIQNHLAHLVRAMRPAISKIQS